MDIRELTWRGKNIEVKVKDMGDIHLRNSIALLKRRKGTPEEKMRDDDWLYVLECEADYREKVNTRFNEVVQKNIKALKQDMW